MKSLKMILGLVFCVLLIQPGFGQPDTLWTKTFGWNYYDGGQTVQQTSDGGFIVTGGVNDHGDGNSDVGLFKTDSLGNLRWTKIYGGGGDDWGYYVQQTLDGGYIVSGSTSSFGAGGYDVWLIKTDSLGDTVWSKTFGGNEYDCGYDAQQTIDGGYIITGFTESFTSSYNSDLWLIKTDSAGDTLWTKKYGGNDTDICFSVQQTSDKGYILTGHTDSFNAYSSDLWLVKTDSLGDTLWTKMFDNGGREWGKSVQETSDGGYVISGTTELIWLNDDVFIVKTDIDGNIVWTKSYAGKGYESGNCIREVEENGFIIAGTTNSYGSGNNDVWLLRTNAIGDTIWTKTIGGEKNDGAKYIQQTPDRGFIIAGFTGSFGAGSFDFWLIKTTIDPLKIVKSDPKPVARYHLLQNYPNPFNPSTTIEFSLPKSEFVELKVYNILGREVSTLVSKKLNQGNHTYTFDGKNLSSGIYYYQLVAGDYREVKKMILIK